MIDWLRSSSSAFVALAGFATLMMWTSGSPGLHDAGGIVAAATLLEGSHPPGQPLHAIVAHAATLLPFGPITFRVALFSAATETLAAWLVGRVTFSLSRAYDAEPDGGRAELAATAATCAALLAPPLLRQATRAEVYGLAAALAFASIHQLVRWWREGDRASLPRAALLAGLAASVHPPHALAAVLTGAAFLPSVMRAGRVRVRSIALAAGCFTLGLTPYVLLPLRTVAGAEQWGDASSWPAFVRYATGAAYHGNLGAGTDSASDLVVGVVVYCVFAVAPALLLVMIGWAASRRTGRPAVSWMPLVAAMVLSLLPGMLQPLDPRIPDHLAYLTPFVGLTIAVAGAGISVSPLPRYLRAVCLALLALSPHTLPQAPETVDLDAPVLETLAFELTNAPPPRALVLAQSDFATMSWRAARATELARPDVAVLPVGTIHERWQWATLTTHPCFRPPPATPNLETALMAARGCVGVLSEKRAPELRAVALLGAYLSEDVLGGRPFVERLDDALGQELAASAAGPHDELASQTRNQLLNRAQRLAEIGRTDEALHITAATLTFLPADLRAPLALASDTRARRRACEVEVDPTSLFEASREDAVRFGAELLFRVGEMEAAQALLLDQVERGDTRALVQLGYHALAIGDRTTAERALRTIRSLGASSESLERALAEPPPTP